VFEDLLNHRDHVRVVDGVDLPASVPTARNTQEDKKNTPSSSFSSSSPPPYQPAPQLRFRHPHKHTKTRNPTQSAINPYNIAAVDNRTRKTKKNQSTARMAMKEPSQSMATGIIIGITVAGVFFLLIVITLLHWCSRRMHPRKVISGEGGGGGGRGGGGQYARGSSSDTTRTSEMSEV